MGMLQAPLNSIWEGSGNVMALDVLRAAGREPGTLEAFAEMLAPSMGADLRLDTHIAATRNALLSLPKMVCVVPWVV